MSAPPVLAKSMGTCKQYKQECIGNTQKALLYTGMSLIAVGVAGNNVSVKSFLEEQANNTSDASNNVTVQSSPREQPHNGCSGVVLDRLRLSGLSTVAIVGVAGAIALPYIKPWTYRFGIPAVCTTIAGISFLTGLFFIPFKRTTEPNKDRIKNMRRMFSVCKLPMWLTFLVCGIISSTGNTYFVEQAKHLDRHLGSWEVPTQVLLLAQTYLGKWLADLVYSAMWKGHGVGKAKMLGVLCCIAAAGMESKRLGVVRSNGLLDKPKEDVPMSVYWLLFQYALLGGADTLLEKSVLEFDEKDKPTRQGKEADPNELVEKSVAKFDEKGMPPREAKEASPNELKEGKGDDPNELKRQCMEIFSKGVSGLGHMCGVLLVFVVGKLTTWFNFTLNRSHLDRYYWLLAVLSAASLVLYAVVRIPQLFRNNCSS